MKKTGFLLAALVAASMLAACDPAPKNEELIVDPIPAGDGPVDVPEDEVCPPSKSGGGCERPD